MSRPPARLGRGSVTEAGLVVPHHDRLALDPDHLVRGDADVFDAGVVRLVGAGTRKTPTSPFFAALTMPLALLIAMRRCSTCPGSPGRRRGPRTGTSVLRNRATDRRRRGQGRGGRRRDVERGGVPALGHVLELEEERQGRVLRDDERVRADRVLLPGLGKPGGQQRRLSEAGSPAPRRRSVRCGRVVTIAGVLPKQRDVEPADDDVAPAITGRTQFSRMRCMEVSSRGLDGSSGQAVVEIAILGDGESQLPRVEFGEIAIRRQRT